MSVLPKCWGTFDVFRPTNCEPEFRECRGGEASYHCKHCGRWMFDQNEDHCGG